MRKTINEWLSVKKTVIERMNDLKQLRAQTAVKTKSTRRYGEETIDDVNEPQYATKELDKRVTEIQNALLLIDSAIKQSNATVKLELSVELDNLLSPMV